MAHDRKSLSIIPPDAPPIFAVDWRCIRYRARRQNWTEGRRRSACSCSTAKNRVGVTAYADLRLNQLQDCMTRFQRGQRWSSKIGLICPTEEIVYLKRWQIGSWAGPDFRQSQRMQPPMNLIEPIGVRIIKISVQVWSGSGPDFRLPPNFQSNPHLIEPLAVA